MITVLIRPLVRIVLVSVVHRSLIGQGVDQQFLETSTVLLKDFHWLVIFIRKVVYSCDPEDSEKHHIIFMSLSVTPCVRNMFETGYYHCSHNLFLWLF